MLRTLYNLSLIGKLAGQGFIPVPYWLKSILDKYPMQVRIIKYARVLKGQRVYSGVPQEVGCASAVTRLLEMVDPSFFGGVHTVDQIVSTILLTNEMEVSDRFIELKNPQHGCVVMNTTEGRNTGHCGIYDGYTKRVWNNNSWTGKWTDSYSLITWKAKFEGFEGRKKLRTRFFFPLSDY